MDPAVRVAGAGDIASIAGLLRRAQDKLEASGSVQRLSVLERDAVARHILVGSAHVLQAEQTIIGVTFVEPVTRETLPALERWCLAEPGPTVWYLRSLVIDHESQGRGLGPRLLDGIKEYVSALGPGVIVLDCWAGNHKLREFYARAGFELLGEFPSGEGFMLAVFAWRTPPAAPAG